jgi:hypothetical protein
MLSVIEKSAAYHLLKRVIPSIFFFAELCVMEATAEMG